MGSKKKEDKKPSIYLLKGMMAYKGYIKHTDTYDMYKKWIKPHVTFQYCQRRISNYDKRRNEKDMTDWKTVKGSSRPEEIDITSSKVTVYIRKNIREVVEGEGADAVHLYKYEEKQMTREEFIAYADLIETTRKSFQNESDISDTQSALLEMDSSTEDRLAILENAVLELDSRIN